MMRRTGQGLMTLVLLPDIKWSPGARADTPGIDFLAVFTGVPVRRPDG